MERKNVLIGKIGKSFKFRNISLLTGEQEYIVFYSTLSKMCPNWHFYIIGTNDFDKVPDDVKQKLFPNNNVHNAFVKGEDCSEKTLENLKEIDVDFALIFTGMFGGVNIPNFIDKKKGSGKCSPLNMFKGAGHYFYLLNHIGCPLYLISEDARYLNVNSLDLYNTARMVFGNCETTTETWEHVKNETDHTLVTNKPVDVHYCHGNKMPMMGYDPNFRDNIDVERKINWKGNPLVVFSSGYGLSKGIGNNWSPSYRFKEYKKYIIDNLKDTKYSDVQIHGKWDDNTVSKYPEVFTGPLMVNPDLDEIKNARYTFIHTMHQDVYNMKMYEYILMGVIPFMHPNVDTMRKLGLPEYVYVKDEKDFLAKMQELDNNKDKYLDVLEQCFNCVKREWLDGSLIINSHMRHIWKDLYNEEWADLPGVGNYLDWFNIDNYCLKKQ